MITASLVRPSRNGNGARARAFLQNNRCAGEYRYVATHLNFAAFVLKRH